MPGFSTTGGIMAKTVKTGKSSGKINDKKSPKKPANTQLEALAKELKSLIPKMDAEGLAFLVEQARIHIYNLHVEELNKAAHAANNAAERSRSITKTAQSKTKQTTAKEAMSLKGTETGSSYYLYYGNANVMFSRSEMVSLVKIANGTGTDQEIGERLFSWFVRERKDIFSTIPIANKSDGLLKTLSGLIKKSFKFR